MKKYLSGAAVFFALLAADRLTKYAAFTYLKDAKPISVIKGVFSLQYLENRGAAFGIFQNQRFFLLLISAIILAAIAVIYIKIPFKKKYMPLNVIAVMVAAGAAGNMIDRIAKGYVVDFFYFELIDFPIFNLADCYVVVAAAAAIFFVLFYYKDEDYDFLKL